MVLYKKIGALLLVISIIVFLLSGLIIVTGSDVTSFTQTVTTSGTINQTSWFIGNGDFPITGTGQLYMGYSLILLSLVVGIIFLDQTLKGNLVKGD